jgi:flagellin
VARNDLSSAAGQFGTGGALAGGVVTDSAAQIDSDASNNQLILAFSGTATDGDSLTLAGIEFTDASATAAARATALAGAINAANLTGITAGDDGSGNLTITNTNSFEEFAVTFDAGGANTIAATNEEDPTTFDVAATAAASTTQLSRRAEEVTLLGTSAVNEGDSFRISVGTGSFDYIAGKGETMEDVARGLKTAVDGGKVADVTTQVVKDGDNWKVLVDYGGAGNIGLSSATNTGGTASGGLFGLDMIDVRTDEGAKAALDNIETLIQNSIDAASSFGSAQGRIESQKNFVSTISDALKSGIGSMVDANMEEASARLQALQVQQQLATQSLSIANQAPQSILSLFR